MALDPIILPIQTQAKEPIDQQLMDDIRLNLERNDQRISLIGGGSGFGFRVNGNLDLLGLGTNPNGGRELDTGYVAQEGPLTLASLYVDEIGLGGNFKFDVKRLSFLGLPISGIKNIFTANTQSIARGSAALNTQSITNSEASIITQSVSYAKPAVAIQNIIQTDIVGQFRLNFLPSVTIDEDYQVGQFVEVDGATDPNNNGFFEIVEINKDNGVNVVVQNVAGVAQSAPAGQVRLALAAYTYLGSLGSNYEVGEDLVLSGHDDPSNDGTFTIYKKNVGGNNFLTFKNAPIIEQATPNGTATTLRFSYNYLASVPDAFAIGEVAVFSGHTDINNNGNFEIKDTNINGGFNIIVYNPSGIVQGGVAGQVDTNRWVYALDQDPDGFFIAGDNAVMAGHTDPNNNGTFTVVDVRYLATNNVVVYNASGVAQAGVGGTVDHAQKAITFREDFSDKFTAGQSVIQIEGTFNGENDEEVLVIDVNRTAVSPFNIIAELTSGILQDGDNGQVASEVRSIFLTGPQDVTLSSDKTIVTYTAIDNEIDDDPLATDTLLVLDILEAPTGCQNVAVNIA
jgi:hypothetical protein